MGYSRYDATAWSAHSASVASTPRDKIFTSRSLHEKLDPAKVVVRESVDSVANPNSTPILLFSDVTGSMGITAEQIIKKDLGTIMGEIYDRKPVSDPHILGGAIGDPEAGDTAPFQITQFESEVGPIVDQLSKIFIEGRGGGNGGEGYAQAWWFAANKVKSDAITKRGRKGYLFTIGDECFLPTLKRSDIQRVFGIDPEGDINANDLYARVCEHWHVFHLIVNPVPMQPVVATWQALLGQNALVVQDIKNLAEVIVSTIQITEGASPEAVADSWDGSVAMVVRKATGHLKPADAAASVRV